MTWKLSSLQFSCVPISSVQLSRVQFFVTPWISAHQASLSITNSWSSPIFMCIESVLPSAHLILCRPLLLLPPIPPSIRVFSNESALHIRWPKYWSFSFSIIPSNEYLGLISFRMDWLDLLAVQGTLKESSPTLQFKRINSSVLSFLYSPTLISKHDHWKNHQFSSVQFSRSVMSDSATPWITARQASLSYTSYQRSLKLLSIESVMPFSHLILCHPLVFLPQSLLLSGSFPMSQLFAWDSQSTGVSASVSVLPMNTQDWSPLGWTGWISLQSKGLSRVFSNTTV